MHTHALVLQSLAHGVLHLHALKQVGVHLGLVEPKATTPALLDPVHGGVRLLDQIVQRPAVLGIQSHPNAALDGKTHAIEREGTAHHIKHAARDLLGARGVARMQVHGKFIPTYAAQHIGLAQAGLQALRDQQQHLVTKKVAHRIVDDFETVEIQEQDGKTRTARLRCADG